MRTFLDTGVLLAAFKGISEDSEKALMLLDDPSREFVISAYLKLELIPQAKFHHQDLELEFYSEFFDSANYYAEATEELAESALELASHNGLQAMDALHVAAAKLFNAEEIITTEKSTKPLFRLSDPKILHLSDC